MIIEHVTIDTQEFATLLREYVKKSIGNNVLSITIRSYNSQIRVEYDDLNSDKARIIANEFSHRTVGL